MDRWSIQSSIVVDLDHIFQYVWSSTNEYRLVDCLCKKSFIMEIKMKNVIGYVFGYREIVSENNMITVSTKSGVCDTYPTEYADKEDFWCNEVRDGEYDDRYIDPSVIISTYETEYQEWLDHNHYDERKCYFSYDISREQYHSLYCFNMAMLYAYMTSIWESDDVLIETLEKTVNKDNIFTGNILDIYKDFNECMSKAYENELKMCLG